MTPKPDASAPLPEHVAQANAEVDALAPEGTALDQRTATPDQRDYLDEDFTERKPMPVIDVYLPGRKKWGKFQCLTSRELEEINSMHRETTQQEDGTSVTRIRQAMYSERIIARAARKPNGRPVVVGELDPGVIMYAEQIADSWFPGDIVAVTNKLFDAMGLSRDAIKNLGKG